MICKAKWQPLNHEAKFGFSFGCCVRGLGFFKWGSKYHTPAASVWESQFMSMVVPDLLFSVQMSSIDWSISSITFMSMILFVHRNVKSWYMTLSRGASAAVVAGYRTETKFDTYLIIKLRYKYHPNRNNSSWRSPQLCLQLISPGFAYVLTQIFWFVGNSYLKKAMYFSRLCPLFPWRLYSQILWHTSSKAAALITDCAHSCVSASFVSSALLSVTSSLHSDYRLHLRIWLIPPQAQLTGFHY